MPDKEIHMMFYRSMKGAIIEAPPRSKPVVVPGFEAHSFFAWREDDPAHDLAKESAPPKIWHICETSTGRSVDYGDTLQQAVDNASRVLGDYGADLIGLKIAAAPKMPAPSTLFDGEVE